MHGWKASCWRVVRVYSVAWVGVLMLALLADPASLSVAALSPINAPQNLPEAWPKEKWLVPRLVDAALPVYDTLENARVGGDSDDFLTYYDAWLVIRIEDGWVLGTLSTRQTPAGWVKLSELVPLEQRLEENRAELPPERIVFRGDIDPHTVNMTVSMHSEPNLSGWNEQVQIKDAANKVLWLAPRVHPVEPEFGPGQYGTTTNQSKELELVADVDHDGRVEFLAVQWNGGPLWQHVTRWNGNGFETVVENKLLTNAGSNDPALFHYVENMPESEASTVKNNASELLVGDWAGVTADGLFRGGVFVETDEESEALQGQAAFSFSPDCSEVRLVRWLRPLARSNQ